ncbi:nitronate monooxygenase [Variovorax paradoxus]|uniref:nitronate monooxygenase n=1 Tax=Variovorax paradoxus TaxID=34073 RepID=UPI003ECC86BE
MSSSRQASAPESAAVLHRPVCDLLRCSLPLVLTGAADPELVAAVTQAGGFGFLGMSEAPPARLREGVLAVRAHTDRHFGVDMNPAATEPALRDAQIAACIELRVPVAGLLGALSRTAVRQLREAGVVVACQVSSVSAACEAEGAGAQILIVQGREAGDAVRGAQPLAAILADVRVLASVPVLAAGGIADGADIAAALAAGAQGAVLDAAALQAHEDEGQGTAPLEKIASAGRRLHQLASDAAASLRGRALRFPERVMLSSPVCYADELAPSSKNN